MSDDRPEHLTTAPQPAGGVLSPVSPDVVPMPGDGPRIVQMLSTEHWSVLSARSLAYNEAFTRAQMY